MKPSWRMQSQLQGVYSQTSRLTRRSGSIVIVWVKPSGLLTLNRLVATGRPPGESNKSHLIIHTEEIICKDFNIWWPTLIWFSTTPIHFHSQHHNIPPFHAPPFLFIQSMSTSFIKVKYKSHFIRRRGEIEWHLSIWATLLRPFVSPSPSVLDA